MNTLNDLELLARKLLAKTYTFEARGVTHTLSPYLHMDYTFEFDTAKRRLGCCKYTRKMITMSRPLAKLNLDKLDTKLTDTLLHEIAHALSYKVYGREGRGHGSNWRSIAMQIGCDGNRCYDGNKIEKPKAKYTLTCPTCEKVVSKHRKPKGDGGYACGSCCKSYSNGKYDSTHDFIVKQNY